MVAKTSFFSSFLVNTVVILTNDCKETRRSSAEEIFQQIYNDVNQSASKVFSFFM